MTDTFCPSPVSLPLHPAQQELPDRQSPYLTRLRPVVGGCLTLIGPLNYEALRRVVDYLPVIFDVFRWQFDPADPEPMVHVPESFRTPALPLLDYSAEPNPRRAADVEVQQRVSAPFTAHAFFDLTLLRVYDTEHRLLVRGHRLLLDDAGFDRIVRYIAEAYSSVVAGDALPDPAPAYAEDVASARLYPNSLAYSEGQTHWRKQFHEVPKSLLNSPQPSQGVQVFYTLAGSDTFCRALEQAAAALGEPPVHLLLAALTIYFARTSGRATCVFGRSVAGRQSKRQMATVGRFDRALPIRLTYQPGQSLRLLVRAIRRQHRADNSHRDYPMSHLTGFLGTNGNPKPALFDVFVKQLPAPPAPLVGNLSCRVERLAGSEADVPLQLLWHEGNAYQPAGLQAVGQATFVGRTELRWLMGQVEHLLTEFARRPDAALGSFDLPMKPVRSSPFTAYAPFRLSSQTVRFAGF